VEGSENGGKESGRDRSKPLNTKQKTMQIQIQIQLQHKPQLHRPMSGKQVGHSSFGPKTSHLFQASSDLSHLVGLGKGVASHSLSQPLTRFSRSSQSSHPLPQSRVASTLKGPPLEQEGRKSDLDTRKKGGFDSPVVLFPTFCKFCGTAIPPLKNQKASSSPTKGRKEFGKNLGTRMRSDFRIRSSTGSLGTENAQQRHKGVGTEKEGDQRIAFVTSYKLADPRFYTICVRNALLYLFFLTGWSAKFQQNSKGEGWVAAQQEGRPNSSGTLFHPSNSKEVHSFRVPTLFFVISSPNEKTGLHKIVKKSAKILNQSGRFKVKVVTNNWVPGLLTNWEGVGKRFAVRRGGNLAHFDTGTASNPGGSEGGSFWERFPLSEGSPDLLVVVDAVSSGDQRGGKAVRLALNEGRKLRIPLFLLTSGGGEWHSGKNSSFEFFIPVNPHKQTEIYHFFNTMVSFFKAGWGRDRGEIG